MRTLLLFVGFFIVGINSAYASDQKMYRATFTNLTKGQVMSAPVWVVHRPGFSLFSLGEEASEGLKHLARDGEVGLLTDELELNDEVTSYVVSGEPILPGQSQEVVFVGSPSLLLSVASMLVSTNDAYVSRTRISLNPGSKKKHRFFLHVFDAGAEINNELCSHIPGPPCGNPLVDTVDNEGFVHFHPGLHLQGDLDPSHTFADIAARVVVERIK